MKSVAAEAHREGSTTFAGIPDPDRYYLFMIGSAPARRQRIPLDFRRYRQLLDALRYAPGTDAARESAVTEFSDLVTSFVLSDVFQWTGAHGGSTDALLQLDVVMEAGELCGLPFELARGADRRFLFESRPPVVVTRRQRGAFSADAHRAWAATPRVLFAWASPPGLPDVPHTTNQQALFEALRPWIEPLDGIPGGADYRKVLTILPRATLAQIGAACDEEARRGAPYTSVHILAHGEPLPSSDMFEQRPGIALHGTSGEVEVVSPQDIAAALAPVRDSASAVTLAICYGGGQAESWLPEGGIAFTLHQAGFPVVLGAQWPLTFEGSAILTRTFYEHLFNGSDVRQAVHDTRLALRACPECHLDWASLVAYVRLPEGYETHRIAVGLGASLAALETASRWADGIAERGHAAHATYIRVDQQLRERRQRLEDYLAASTGHSALSAENYGLLGSAHKRRAEFLHTWSHDSTEQAAGGTPTAQQIIEELEQAHHWYSRGFARHRDSHWLSGQALSLDLLLTGRIAQPVFLDYTLLLAEEQVAASREEFWALGTIAELHMLRSSGPEDSCLEDAGRALHLMVQRAGRASAAVHVTKRQLRRYVTWWTPQSGYFGGHAGFERQARVLLDTLDRLVS